MWSVLCFPLSNVTGLPALSVVWTAGNATQQIEFLNWTVANGIELFEHTATGNIKDRPEELVAVDMEADLRILHRLEERAPQEIRRWYIIESNDDQIVLIKMKWQ